MTLLDTIAVVSVDYSQFYIQTGEPEDFEPLWLDDYGLSLASEFAPGQFLMTCMRQWAELPVRVQILEQHPGEPDPAWGDVVEVSIVAGDRPAITGWGGETPTSLPLDVGVSYRLRYLIKDADLARDDEPGDSYWVQFWPAPIDPPRILVQESLAGIYWHAAKGVQFVNEAVSTLPEGDRLNAAIDLALERYPEAAERIRNDPSAAWILTSTVSIVAHNAGVEHDARLALIAERAAS